MLRVSCNLKKILDERKISRYQISQSTSLSFKTLSDYYNDRTLRYSTDVLEKLCDYLECTPGDLIVLVEN